MKDLFNRRPVFEVIKGTCIIYRGPLTPFPLQYMLTGSDLHVLHNLPAIILIKSMHGARKELCALDPVAK